MIIVNAEYDEAYPIASVTALRKILDDSSEILWTKGKHITSNQTEVIRELIDLIVDRINSSDTVQIYSDGHSDQRIPENLLLCKPQIYLI